MNIILPPFLDRIICCAAAWAQRNEPLRLTSITLPNCSGVTEIEGTQPTIPAKQHRISMPPMRDAAASNASVIAEDEVTSTGVVFILPGNSSWSWEI